VRHGRANCGLNCVSAQDNLPMDHGLPAFPGLTWL
jgi:hypothetical protein